MALTPEQSRGLVAIHEASHLYVYALRAGRFDATATISSDPSSQFLGVMNPDYGYDSSFDYYVVTVAGSLGEYLLSKELPTASDAVVLSRGEFFMAESDASRIEVDLGEEDSTFVRACLCAGLSLVSGVDVVDRIALRLFDTGEIDFDGVVESFMAEKSIQKRSSFPWVGTDPSEMFVAEKRMS